MRNAFVEELVSIARENSKIALVVGDLGYSVVEPFAGSFPDRFINAGVAEQNMTGLAAGMASEGYHVFTYSIANFSTFRCAEQIRNDVDYHNLPVTVVSVGGGLAYGSLGYSHHAVQDYALMRTMPNVLIAAPGDALEVRACLRYLTLHECPSYLRLGKAGEPRFHTELPEVYPGRWLTIRKGRGRPRALLSTGTALHVAMKWGQEPQFREFDVCSLPLWSMSHKHTQREYFSLYDEIVTVEDHLQDGGFGSWLLEARSLQSTGSTIRTIALSENVCGTVGSETALHLAGGILPSIITNSDL